MALIGNFSGVWHLYQFQLYLRWCREVVKTNNYHMCCKCNISPKKSKFVHPIQAACIAVFINFGLLLTWSTYVLRRRNTLCYGSFLFGWGDLYLIAWKEWGNSLGSLDEHCWLSPIQDQDPAGLMGTWIRTQQVNTALFQAYIATLIDRYFRIADTMRDM